MTWKQGVVFGMTLGLAAALAAPAAAGLVAAYDLNSSSNLTQAGFTGVPVGHAYSAGSGYGWTSTAGLDARDRGGAGGHVPADLLRDFHFAPTDQTFLVDLANGDYAVTVYIYDLTHTHDLIDVSAEGVLKLSAVTTTPAAPVIETFDTPVADGQLNLLIHNGGGSDPNWVLCGLEINREEESPPSGGPVPEPAALGLFGALLLCRRRRR
jgi:MYXO-CTERM domain-containing protein